MIEIGVIEFLQKNRDAKFSVQVSRDIEKNGRTAEIRLFFRFTHLDWNGNNIREMMEIGKTTEETKL